MLFDSCTFRTVTIFPCTENSDLSGRSGCRQGARAAGSMYACGWLPARSTSSSA